MRDPTWPAPRWTKLLRDVAGERGRVAAMVVAVTVSVAAVGAVLGARAILTREIARSYLGTQPASATLEVPGGVDAALLDAVRALPEVAAAEARSVVVARVQVGADWRPLLLFVVDDFAALRLNTFRGERGAWPPPLGTVLIERSATGMVGADLFADIVVKTPHGAARAVRISGIVHDPGLAPAWQERQGYAYATRETAALLGEPAALDELRIGLKDAGADLRAIEAAAAKVAAVVVASGRHVHQVRVPPPRMHPHQRQMGVILTMMLAFSATTLLLSAVLVATSLAAMLARQVREIGVMKTIGATGTQVAAMYLVLVIAIGAVASALALPLGALSARAFATAVSSMLNFDLADTSVPAWVYALQLAAGILIPIVFAAVPVRSASRATVRAALDRHDTEVVALRPYTAKLPQSVRGALRRPARSTLTLTLLAAGGAMFMAALDVKQSWRHTIAKMGEARLYDVEVRLHTGASPELLAALRTMDGVRRVEAWGYAPAAFAQEGRIDVVRTYPDRGHGSLIVSAPSLPTELVKLPVLQGRWLRPDDEGVVVLNHGALAQHPGAALGGDVALSVDGVRSTWRLVGVVEEIGAAGVAYVPAAAFARLTGDASRVVRVASSAATIDDRADVVREIERVLAAHDAPVDVVVPLAELRSAVGDHIQILIDALSALAAVMALVGILGLSSAIGTSVVERTREIGVMKTLGATPSRVRRLIVSEALVIAAASVVLALIVSLPLAWAIDEVVGRLGFLAPLDFQIDPMGVALWSVLVVVAATLAALAPAARAAALRPKDALAALC